MMTFRLRVATAAASAACAVLASTGSGDAAWVARNLLRGLMERPPVAAGEAALDAGRLVGCMRTARDLDRLASSLDNQMIVIQDTTSRVNYWRSIEDRPQLPRPDRTEQQMRAEYEHRHSEQAEMQRLLDRDTRTYRNQLAGYEAGVKSFEQDCAGGFTGDDLETAKAQLNADRKP